MDRGIRRIAVVNRGEAAMRLINAVRELRYDRGRAGDDLRAIALHTQAERTAMFVREADEAVCLDDDRAPDTGSPYLDLAALERALVASRADAAWVGWGFVAERPEFAELCDRLGVVFIGPSADVMRALGDKIEAKRLAERSGVPVAPWSGGPVDSIDDARRHAEAIGFPLMIKATAGGGGRGIRKVDDVDGLTEAFTSARAEGLKAFGDATVFMERVVSDARHVEVQIIADAHGSVWAVGVRDCTMQRRNQKVIEESHCIALTAEQDRDLRAAAVRLATAAGYQNAGTVEFLYQPGDRSFAFLEVNTRLQVEHPVTELTTGLDLVKLQIHVAGGGHLDGDPPATAGYAIEARLNAEDPQRGFAPAPGVVETLTLPVGPGIRVDTGIGEGDVIPPEYDSMIAKIIASGRDRDEALSRLHRALAQMSVLVRGGTTNKSFLIDLLDRPEVITGQIDTAWLDRLTAAGEHLPTRHTDVALVAAALDADHEQAVVDRVTFLGWANRGRPQAALDVGRDLEMRHGSESYVVGVRTLGPSRFEIELGGVTVPVEVERLGRARSRLTVGRHVFGVVSTTQDSDQLVEVDGVAHRFSRDDAGIVRAPSSALVVGVDVAIDDVVEQGQRLGMIEAMKMEMAVVAPIAGRVRDVFVSRNVQVVAGAPLFRLESDDGGDAVPDAGQRHIDLGALAGADTAPPAALLEAFVLGYDVEPTRARAQVDDGSVTPASAVAILDAFADLCAVAPERQDVDGETVTSSREYFNTFLRSLDADREGLPTWFVDRLVRAVGHYGIERLDPSDRLADALLRIFVAQQRRDDQVGVVMALLDQQQTPIPGLRDTLDRLIEATRRRHPSIASMSRTVRHSLFDRPVIDSTRRDVSATMRRLASDLAGSSGAHHAAIDTADRLVACPLPLVPILAEGGLFADADAAGPLLEVLTRRYYRIRALGKLTVERIDAHDVVRSSYAHNDRTVHIVAVRAGAGDLPAALGAVARAASTLPPSDNTVADVYLPLPPSSATDVDALAIEFSTVLGTAQLPASVRRVSLIPAHPRTTVPVLTFRRAGSSGVRPYWMEFDDDVPSITDPATFEEDIKFRGLHPMIARRLQMWRLENFEISPLPAAGDVHLFDCVARVGASDRRLIAVAEVRDVTPVRDEDGNVIALPEVEHVLVGCLDALREARGRLAGAAGLEWNRIMLYVWPVVDLPPDAFDAVARRLAPLTEGVGLEQVVVSGSLASAGSDPVEAVVRIGYEPGRGVTVRLTEPPTEPMQPLDDYTRKLVQTRRRGLTYPYELIPALRGPQGSFVEHDLDDDGALVAVDRPPGGNTAGVVIGVVSTPTDAAPRGCPTRRRARRSDQGDGLDRRAGMRSAARRDRTRHDARRADRMVRALGRRQDRDGFGQRESRLGGAGAPAARRAHPARRRGQHRRRGDQRRRPAVLERRGHDAHAHQGHPGDDARQRNGAHRQAGHRVLRGRGGRGQPRHRWVREDHGPERRGPVLGPDPHRGQRVAPPPLRTHLSRSGRTLAASGHDHRPGRPRRADRAASRRRGRLPHRG